MFASMDKHGFVLNEYTENLNATKFGMAWLRQHSRRFHLVDLVALPRGLRVSLDNAHFSIPDRRFVQVALQCPTRIIVTTDPDYSPAVTAILRREGGIEVLGPAEALEFIRRMEQPQA
jgi:hypothetical protein